MSPSNKKPPRRGLTEFINARWHDGGQLSSAQLEPIIYRELRRLANKYMAHERHNHTLQVTGLVHEALMRVCGPSQGYVDERHFYATAARVMRHVLVDHAKARHAEKRRPDPSFIATLSDNYIAATRDDDFNLLELHEALDKLEREDEAAARCVELHYFGGFTTQEIAGAMNVSVSTVTRNLRAGKAWLVATLQWKG